jgi:hypothetical protein
MCIVQFSVGRQVYTQRRNEVINVLLVALGPSASGFKLEAGDGNPFSSENAYIDLGF